MMQKTCWLGEKKSFWVKVCVFKSVLIRNKLENLTVLLFNCLVGLFMLLELTKPEDKEVDMAIFLIFLLKQKEWE